MEASRGDRPRSSHLQVVALGAFKKWGTWSLDVKKASLRADGLQREEFLCAPAACGPSGTHRIWNWHAPSSALNDGPAAFQKTLQRSRFRSLARARCPRFRRVASGFFFLAGVGAAVGAPTTHIGEVLGCGEPAIFLKARKFRGRRVGGLKSQEQSFAHVGMGWPQANGFPI